MTVSELLPCPFCGEQPHFTPRQGSFAAYVACINESCGVQPESGSMDPAYAKARWNTRAMKAAEPLQQGDEVRDVLIEAQVLSRRLAQLIILTDDEKAVFAKIDKAIKAIGSQSIEGERG